MSTEEILTEFEPKQQNLLMILLEIQKNNPANYLPEDDLDKVARYLNINRSAVFGVAAYYTMLSLKPRGRNIIRVCCSPVCKMLGTDFVLQQIEKILKIKPDETTTDKRFSLEISECLGFCFQSPAMLINEDMHGDLNDADMVSIFQQYK